MSKNLIKHECGCETTTDGPSEEKSFCETHWTQLSRCRHPSWKSVLGGKEVCELCGAVGEERRYLKLDDPTLDLTDTFTRIFALAEHWQREAKASHVEVNQIRELLKVARCPNSRCDNKGTLGNEDGYIEPCEWCAARAAALGLNMVYMGVSEGK